MTTRRPAAPKAGRRPARSEPVARLLVDVPLPHLDRPFDYYVPESLDAEVRAGSRVRVRFAGRLVDAYVLERLATSEHEGTLAFVERAVGDEAVLTAETASLFRAVAERWAGNFVDVVRLGVPARHARAESSPARPPGPLPAHTPELSRYRAGPAFLGAVAAGKAARAVWSVLPGDEWPARLAAVVRTAHDHRRGVIVVVPDVRDLARLDAAVTAVLGGGRHVALSADLGPAERYRRWLAVRRGLVTVAIGTRSVAYAPVADLGLVAIWDDGDDLHAEPRAPYPHARDVLALRSAQAGAALVVAGHARTAEAQLLVDTGWAHEIVAERDELRQAVPRVRPVADDVEIARDPGAAAARLPSLAWRTTRDSLQAGRAVLVQVPRGGYLPALACARDRTPARCAVCAGPLAAPSGHGVPACRWCARPAPDWSCPSCGGGRLRAAVVGTGRTAEELGRAFPGFPVRTSGGEHVLADVPGDPAVVVATPGAEPLCPGGYGAALLLDGWALLSRPDLRAAEEAFRRWANAAALVRPGGTVVVGADAGVAAVQALVRWDPAGFASRELAERGELGFPPVSRMASLTGSPAAVADMVADIVADLAGDLAGEVEGGAVGEVLGALELPQSLQVIGPVSVDAETHRVLLRVARAHGANLAHALKAAAAGRSARRSADPVRIQLDPLELI